MVAVTESSLMVGELVDHAFFLADELPNAVFPRVDVLRLMNMGFKQVGEQLGNRYATITTGMPEGLQEYQLPNAMAVYGSDVEVTSVTYSDAVTAEVALSAASTNFDPIEVLYGTPVEYIVKGDKLLVSPVPDENLVTPTLKVTYRTQQDKYDESRYPELTDAQAEAAVYYAVWQMKLRDDETNVSDRWRTEYQERFRALRNTRTGVYKAS